LYDIILKKVQREYNDIIKLDQSYSSILALLTRLRQGAIAPYIISDEAKRIKNKKKKNSLDRDFVTYNLDKVQHGMQTAKIQKIINLLDTIKNGGDNNSSNTTTIPCGSSTRTTSRSRDPGTGLRPVEEDALCASDAGSVIQVKEKIIIYSMFVTALDLLNETIKKYLPGFKIVQIDGDTKNRNQILEQFKNSDIDCLLTTYKVSAEGLTITEANHCILLEPWWNSATLFQAQSRLWRIGQTRPVIVYNLITQDTIEERILDICDKKDLMIQSYLSSSTKKIGDKCKLNKAVLHKLLTNKVNLHI
jgi:SNF2 family DNA or RNA helicase